MARMISPTELQQAAEAIRAGRLVAFPTETVYGLGANALDPEAVARIYKAKGRPATSPLIVHVASTEQAQSLAAEWPHTAHLLAEKFWPGPLTLVLRKKETIPDIVTAGLPTVGLRVPANPIALALIREAGVPIAAPSANTFTQLSPTRAEHVRASLGDRIDFILDGGRTDVGIESTVVAITPQSIELLRPGIISREDIESVAGPIQLATEQDHRSPGQHRRHYQPRTPLIFSNHAHPTQGRGTTLRIANSKPEAYAARLYDTLHELDSQGFDWIAVEPPPDEPGWDAVRDRLRRAAAK